MEVGSTPVQGAQVVGRVAQLLRIVGHGPRTGRTTADVVKESGLTRPTAYRLLASLAAEGLLEHDGGSGRWYLGPEAYILGSLSARRYDIEDLARDNVRRLADETEESAFLSVLRGNGTVCLLREEGSFPIRSFVLHEGVRFPLGVASAGLAILAYHSDEEIEAYLAESAEDLAGWGPGHSPEGIRERIRLTRETGYAVNPGLIVEGSWGMGAAVFDSAGRPLWALSLTGIEPRFRGERGQLLGKLLLEEAHKITVKLQTRPAAGG